MELDPLATAADRRRQPPRRIGQQDQHGLRSRFLQRLQQGIGRRGVHRVGRVDGDHLPAAELAAHGQPGGQLADLVDHDLGAWRAVLAQAEGQFHPVRMRAGRAQPATPAMPAGFAVHRLGAQQAAHETLRERTLAQAGGTAQQQGVRQRAALATGLQPRPMILVPWQCVHRADPSNHSIKACVAACSTCPGAWLASMTRKRFGSCAARSR